MSNITPGWNITATRVVKITFQIHTQEKRLISMIHFSRKRVYLMDSIQFGFNLFGVCGNFILLMLIIVIN